MPVRDSLQLLARDPVRWLGQGRKEGETMRLDLGPARLTVLTRHPSKPIALRLYVGPLRLHWYLSRYTLRVSVDRR